MSETETADAATTETEQTQISRTEAEKAFEARDKAKARARELEQQIAGYEKAQADAERRKAEEEGDLQKQLQIVASERDQLSTSLLETEAQLSQIRREQKFSLIERNVLDQIPDEINRPMAKLAMSGILSRASDDASEEDTVKSILDEFKKTAPHFLTKSTGAPARGGIIPPDGAQILTREQVVSEAEASMKERGVRGFKKLF